MFGHIYKFIYIYCAVILLLIGNAYCTRILADLLGQGQQSNDKPLFGLGNLLPSLNFGIGVGLGGHKNYKTNQQASGEYPYGYNEESGFGHPHGGPPGHHYSGHGHGHGHGYGHGHDHGHGSYYPHKYPQKQPYPYQPGAQQPYPYQPGEQQPFYPNSEYTTPPSHLFQPNYSYKPNYPSNTNVVQPTRGQFPDQQTTIENTNEKMPYTFSDTFKTTSTPRTTTTPKLDYEIDIRFGNNNKTTTQNSEITKTTENTEENVQSSTQEKQGISLSSDSDQTDQISFPSDE